MWNPEDNSFDHDRWASSGEAKWRRLIFWTQAAPQSPLWAIVPDRPGKADATFAKWEKYALDLKLAGIPLAIAVQDGMNADMVRALPIQPDVVCVGGSTDWKWSTAEMWALNFPRTHLLRCNSPSRLYDLEKWGYESCDGTGWNRGDIAQTRGLEEWARRGNEHKHPLWQHVCRAERKAQRQAKGQPTQLTFA